MVPSMLILARVLPKRWIFFLSVEGTKAIPKLQLHELHSDNLT